MPLEITTNIPCPMLCRYCPQLALSSAYSGPRRMNAGVGFFNAPEPRTFFPAPIGELPSYVAEHRSRFEHLLRECR